MPPRKVQAPSVIVPPPFASIEEVSEPSIQKEGSPSRPAFGTTIIEENFPELPPSTGSPSEPAQDHVPPFTMDEFVSALKSAGKSKAPDAGKLREPEPFSGRDPKKIKAFIFQCQLYFWGSSKFEDDSRKVNFALSYLRDIAQEWFEPGISGLTPEPPLWLTDWEAFLDELRRNFGLFDEEGSAEHELNNLRMRDNQRISDYLVRFSGLSVRCPWGEPALRYRFYKGLPLRIKDELSKDEGKPRKLEVMRRAAQNIDARYWEHVQERTRDQQQHTQRTLSKATTSTSTASISTPTITPKPPIRFKQKSTKTKDDKPAKPWVDLTGKLDSRGKLTQEER